VLDALTGLEVRNPDGGINRHLGFLGLTREQINSNDITTSDLDSINGASFGTLALGPNSLLTQTVLLSSSSSSDLMPSQSYMATRNPAVFTDSFTKGDKPFTLAARYSGIASSHFAQLPTGNDIEALVTQTTSLNLVVIADADIAADRFWVQQSNFFGETVFTPFANNGDFILNMLENLSGSAKLIGIRSRGTFARPFTKVQAIQVVAEEKFREQEKRLQAQLEETEVQLEALQTEGDSLALSAEQESAITQFTEQRIAIRKSLRDVQFQLQRDIDELGDKLKLINIVATPLALVLLLFLSAKMFTKRAPKKRLVSINDSLNEQENMASEALADARPNEPVNDKNASEKDEDLISDEPRQRGGNKRNKDEIEHVIRIDDAYVNKHSTKEEKT
jgi:ABC-type uncharacterized transport system involved in gliding motility auxiliary subunit